MDWNCSANVAAFVSFSAAKDVRSPLRTNPRSTLVYLTQRLIRTGWMIALIGCCGARVFNRAFAGEPGRPEQQWHQQVFPCWSLSVMVLGILPHLMRTLAGGLLLAN